MSKWKLDTIDIGLIDEAELNANQMTEQAFERLVTNIKQSGGLSSAIGCYKRENGRFVIISGHHRYRACVKLRYKEVPVIYANEKDLTKDEIIALQLSHNSLHGDDDKGILKRLFEEIQSVDFKEFANVEINEIKGIDVDSVSFVAESEHFTISFVLYKKDYEALKELLGIIQEENEHSDMVVLADSADSEQPLLSLMREINKKFKVKSSNISFAKILEMAKTQLSITKLKQMVNIGILRETKIPADNRVVLSPEQIAKLEKEYPQLRFFVQSSKERIFSDEEYREAGVEVVEELSNCQYLFGVKEANIESLLNNKHYFFFGHIAKMQQYNKPLLQSMVDKEITFTDYEYLTDDQGKRVCAFGWWAGVVGIYNTLRLYGLKYKCFKLPPLDRRSSVESMKAELCSIVPIIKNRRVRILVTGKGRCSQGVQDVLDSMGIIAANVEQYLTSRNRPCYCVASLDNLVSRYDGKSFKRFDFKESPQCYRSDFDKYIPCTDILITAHSWQPNQPVYVSKETIANPLNRIKVIGDITCDIDGSIKTTIRPTSHIAPYYDIDVSLHEVDLFSDTDNISVMAVDNLPNALAHEASKYFGERLCQCVFPALFGKQKNTKEIRRATILNEGRLTEPYIYLNSLLNSSE